MTIFMQYLQRVSSRARSKVLAKEKGKHLSLGRRSRYIGIEMSEREREKEKSTKRIEETTG